MITLAVDKFGRILIPKAVRKRHGWSPGTALVLTDDRQSVRLERAVTATSAPALTLQDGHLVFECEWLGAPGSDPVREAIEADRLERLERIAS